MYPQISVSCCLLLRGKLWQLPAKLLLVLGQDIMWCKDNKLYDILLELTLGLTMTEVSLCPDRYDSRSWFEHFKCPASVLKQRAWGELNVVKLVTDHPVHIGLNFKSAFLLPFPHTAPLLLLRLDKIVVYSDQRLWERPHKTVRGRSREGS